MNITVKSLVFLLFTMVSTHGAQIQKIHSDDEPSSCWSMASCLVSLAKETSNAIFVPDETPTWGRAITKTSMGMLGHLLKYSAFDYSGRNVSVYNVCTWTSTTLLLNGLKEITYLVFDSITSPNLKHMARDASKSHFNREKYESLKKKRDNDLSRLSRAGELLLNSTLLLHGEYLFIEDALMINQLGVSLISFSYPKHLNLCPQTNWFCRPIHTPLFMLLYAASLAYNFYDLSYFNDPSFLTRGQIPLLELVTNLARTDASANFARSYGISTRYLKQFELWDQNKYNLYVKAKKFYLFDRMIHRGMCDHGNVMIYSNFLLVLKNAGNYLWEITTDEDQNIVLEPITNESNRQRRHSQNPSLTEDQDSKFIISALPPLENMNLASLAQTPNLTGQKPKIKKKGVPGQPRYDLENHPRNNPSSSITSSADIDLRRTEALSRLQDLRRVYPIKVSLIDEELKKACKFLNGVVIPVTGSVYKLQWSIGPNNFAMNFETPHGQDSNQYKGNKLDRVLSVLETCYLVGLDKDHIEKLTHAYNLGHLWRLDKFMYYIFSNRASGGARL